MINPYLQGKITPKKQNDGEATLTKIMTREDGFINLSKKSAEEAERFVRAMLPWPVAWTRVNLQMMPIGLVSKSTNDKSNIKRLKIHKAYVEDGKLVLDEVQLEGRDKVSWKQFKEGYKEADFAVTG